MIFKKNSGLMLVLIVFGFSLFLNFYNLEFLPAGFHNDEAEHGLEALRILRGGSKLLGLSSFYGVPLPSFLHQVLTVWLFGDSVFGLRAASALVGSFSLLFFFLLVRLLFDQKIALLATVFLSFSHFWVAFSRLGINYNLSVLMMIVTFIFLVGTVKGGSLKEGFFLGFFSGLSWYLYFSSRMVPIVVVAVLIFAFLKGLVKERLKMALLILVGFLLTSLPMLLVYLENPGGFMARTNNVFLFSPEVKPWVEDVYRTDSKVEILAFQIRRTLNLSSNNSESSGQYGYVGRILDIPTLIFFLLGMLMALLRFRNWESFFLLLWFWSIIILGSFLTVPPLFMPRILGALPAVYIFSSCGFYHFGKGLISFFRKKGAWLKLGLEFLLGAVMVIVILQNLYIYFVFYPDKVWGTSNKYLATKIARIIDNFQDYRVVFLTSPFLYADFATLAYLAPRTQRISVSEPGNYSFDPGARKTIYLFYPEYYPKFLEAKKIYPLAEAEGIGLLSQAGAAAYLLRVD